MTERQLRALVGVLVAALVVVLAATGIILTGRNGREAAVAGASPPASRSAAPSPTPSPSPSPRPTVAPTATPTAAPTPTAVPTPVPAPTATATFASLRLDATSDTAGGADRVITFTSDGPGTMSVKLTTEAGGTTHICFLAGTKSLGCKDWKTGTFTGRTTQAHTDWKVTLRGKAAATPIVGVTSTFQTLTPKIKIENARFDGTDAPTLNGITVLVVPRANGDARLVAEWGGHPFQYEIHTFNVTKGTDGPDYPEQGPNVGVDQAIPVTANDTWRIGLKNSATGFGITPMTATISWP